MTRARIAILTAVVLGIGAGAAFAVAAYGLVAPARAVVGVPPADLAAEPVSFPSFSGARLSGWFAPGRPGAGFVVLMHGVRGNRTDMLGRARLLREEGFGVLLFDFQAHGESEGKRIGFGHLEALDARAAVAFARARAASERIGAIGVSLGGAAALLGPAPLAVEALVLEAVYGDVREAMANRLRARLGPAGPLLAPLLEFAAGGFAGLRADDLRPIDRIAEVAAPVLVIAGSEDDRTTLDESRRLFGRAPEPKQLWVVEGAGHEDFERRARDDYRQIVPAFLRASLSRR